MGKNRKKPHPPDVLVSRSGLSVFMFTLVSDSAKSWVEGNVESEGWQWMGDATFVVDHRFALDLYRGMKDAGLVIK